MSDLRKRTCVNYLKDAGLMILLCLGLWAIIVIEYAIMGIGSGGFSSALRSAMIVLGFYILLVNGLYAMYGPAWTDSLILSMSVRRSDIFVGNIIKEVAFAIFGLGILLVCCVLSGGESLIQFSFLMAGQSLVMAGIGRIAGHKIKKYGKIAIIVLIAISASVGCFLGISLAIKGLFFSWISYSVGAAIGIFIACVVVYGICQIFVYRLNSKAMVH